MRSVELAWQLCLDFAGQIAFGCFGYGAARLVPLDACNREPDRLMFLWALALLFFNDRI